MTTLPYHWLRTLEEGLTQTNQIPLWGSPPLFPAAEFCRALKEMFELDELNLQCLTSSWKTGETLLDGLGEKPVVTSVELAPLTGKAFWALPKEGADALVKAALTKPGSERKSFSDEGLRAGYYRYTILEMLSWLQKNRAFGDLFPLLAQDTHIPSYEAMCLDVQITLNGQTFTGRIICENHFFEDFKKHFSGQKPDLLKSDFAASLTLELCLEVGSVVLNFEEWQGVNEGDFIALDRCLFDPETKKGMVDIILGKTPLFRTKLKEGSLKILDYSFYYAEETPMEDEELNDKNRLPPKENTPEGEEPEPFLEEPEPFLEEPFLEEPVNESNEESPEHLWSAEKGEAPLEALLASSEVPVSLTVEVGRLEMPLHKVLELKPGNTLELKAHPEDVVFLSLNGKRVGRAELVKIGDVLGIKILQLGK